MTGIDTNEVALSIAREEARKWEVLDRVSFVHSACEIDPLLPDDAFDLVFTKSVLVLFSDKLESILKIINKKMKQNGKFIFVENSRGNAIISALRRFRRRNGNGKRPTLFTEREVDIIRKLFDVTLTKRTRFRPCYLIVGQKRSE